MKATARSYAGSFSGLRVAFIVLAFASMLLATGVQQRAADASPSIVFDGSVGMGAPPSTLGPYNMTSFGLDPRSEGETVNDVVDAAGTVAFGHPLTHLRAASGWATWSHGYAGDVYHTSQPSVRVTLPPDTRAFYFYAEPNPFAVFNIVATAEDGTTSGPIAVDGYAGARYFGFYAADEDNIASIAVSSTVDFAIGEFGIARACTAIGADAGPDRTVLSGDTVRFDASHSACLGSITAFHWDFGDSSSDDGRIRAHRFSVPGDYPVTLTTRDAAGHTATDTATIHVDYIRQTAEFEQQLLLGHVKASASAKYFWWGVNPQGQDVYWVVQLSARQEGLLQTTVAILPSYANVLQIGNQCFWTALPKITRTVGLGKSEQTWGVDVLVVGTNVLTVRGFWLGSGGFNPDRPGVPVPNWRCESADFVSPTVL